VPSDFAPLIEPQQTITKLVLSTKTSVNAANQDYEKLTDVSAVTPSPPVHAARLNGLLKTLANAEGAVAESIKARKILISALEKILDSNRTSLSGEEHLLSQLSTRRVEIDSKKREVEESIMRGFASSGSPSGSITASDGSPAAGQTPGTPPSELDRPEVEALTPPGYTQPPAAEPVPGLDIGTSNGGSKDSVPAQTPSQSPPAAGSDLLSSLATSSTYGAYARPASSASGNSAKKRKLNNGDEFPDFGGEDAMDGLDADVAEMLRQDDGSGA
jgi:regulator of Ty1 transposition protein 103